MNMNNKIRLEIPLSEMLSPFSEKITRKIEKELKKVSKPIRGGRRIRGEALFGILQKYRYNYISKLPDVAKTRKNKAREETAMQVIKSVLAPYNPDARVIYDRYLKKAIAENTKPYSYTWFRVICDGMQK